MLVSPVVLGIVAALGTVVFRVASVVLWVVCVVLRVASVVAAVVPTPPVGDTVSLAGFLRQPANRQAIMIQLNAKIRILLILITSIKIGIA